MLDYNYRKDGRNSKTKSPILHQDGMAWLAGWECAWKAAAILLSSCADGHNTKLMDQGGEDQIRSEESTELNKYL